ncbi:histidine phosphatase family protein [Kitasatospora sp. NPDC001660]
MELILVRHGRTDANARRRLPVSGGIPLDEVGREQVRRTAERLRDEAPRVAVVHASDATRALQTAAVLRRALCPGLPVLAEPRLREIDWGLLRGARSDAGAESAGGEGGSGGEETALARWTSDPTVRLPGGESLLDVRERVRAFLRSLPATAGDGAVLVVSHAVTLTVLTAEAARWPLLETWHSHRAHLATGQYRRLVPVSP